MVGVGSRAGARWQAVSAASGVQDRDARPAEVVRFGFDLRIVDVTSKRQLVAGS
jgi:hypothetical protein